MSDTPDWCSRTGASGGLKTLSDVAGALQHLAARAGGKVELAEALDATRREAEAGLELLAAGNSDEPSIAELSDRLVSCMDAIPVEALRSVSPDEAIPGAEALLDLAIASEPLSAQRLTFVEILLARLCTAPRGTRYGVVRDPVSIHPRLRALCDRAPSPPPHVLDELERDILSEARRIESSSSDTPAHPSTRFEDLIIAAGHTRLHPRVLRATVFLEAVRLGEFSPAPQGRPASSHTSGFASTDDTDASQPIPHRPAELPDIEAARPASVNPPPSEAGLWSGPSKYTPPALLRAEPRWHIDATANPSAPVPRRHLAGRPLAAAAALLGLGVLAAWSWTGPPTSVRLLAQHDLARFTPWLQAGYRDTRDGHGVMVATVSPRWVHLSREERERTIRDTVRNLHRSGVEDVLLFDDQHRPVFLEAPHVSPAPSP